MRLKITKRLGRFYRKITSNLFLITGYQSKTFSNSRTVFRMSSKAELTLKLAVNSARPRTIQSIKEYLLCLTHLYVSPLKPLVGVEDTNTNGIISCAPM